MICKVPSNPYLCDSMILGGQVSLFLGVHSAGGPPDHSKRVSDGFWAGREGGEHFGSSPKRCSRQTSQAACSSSATSGTLISARPQQRAAP